MDGCRILSYTEFFICTESELDKDKFTSRE